VNKKIGVKLLVCCFPESKGGTWNIPNFQHWKIPPDPLELLGFLVGFFFSRFQTLCRGGVHFFYAKSSFTSLHFPSLVRHLTPLISPTHPVGPGDMFGGKGTITQTHQLRQSLEGHLRRFVWHTSHGTGGGMLGGLNFKVKPGWGWWKTVGSFVLLIVWLQGKSPKLRFAWKECLDKK